MTVRKVLVALVALIGLSGATPAHAVKLWGGGWRVDRPQGPGWVFYAAAQTADREDIGMDLFFAQVPGTGHTSAILPSDVGVEIVFIANGHSGRQAKDKDRKEYFLKMLRPDSTQWEVIAAQLSKEQDKVPRDKRWSGVLRYRFRPDELPYGVTTFKVDFPYDNDPPFIMIHRVRKTLDRLLAEAAGAEKGELPDEVAPKPVPVIPAVEPPVTKPPTGELFDPSAYQRQQEAEREKERREREAHADRERQEMADRREREMQSSRERQIEETSEFVLVIPKAEVSKANMAMGLRPRVAWTIDGRVGQAVEYQLGVERYVARLPQGARVGLAFPRADKKYWEYRLSKDGRTLTVAFVPGGGRQ